MKKKPKKKPSKKFTIDEASKMLGISRQGVYYAISAKRLAAEKGQVVQTVWFISKSAIEDYRRLYSRKRPKKK